MTINRLPGVIAPNVPLGGTFRITHGEAWISHVANADAIELDGCFTAEELRRFIEILEGRHG